jgi:hypothetical protein
MNGYITTDEIAKIVNYFFGLNGTKGLRNAVAFLLSHFCLLRGDSARKAEFPGLQVINLENEGFLRCPAMVLMMRQGKNKQMG